MDSAISQPNATCFGNPTAGVSHPAAGRPGPAGSESCRRNNRARAARTSVLGYGKIQGQLFGADVRLHNASRGHSPHVECLALGKLDDADAFGMAKRRQSETGSGNKTCFDGKVDV